MLYNRLRTDAFSVPVQNTLRVHKHMIMINVLNLHITVTALCVGNVGLLAADDAATVLTLR